MPAQAPATPLPAIRVRMLLATSFGVGYAPVASGTFGSIPGLALVWGLWVAGGTAAVGAGLVGIVAVGWWAADGAAAHLALRDPGPVVVDEVAGQMLSLLFVPPTATTLALGFFFFRLFDVWKPFPARQLEALPGGWGIMADDLAAAVYANLMVHATLAFAPAWMGT